MDMAPTRTQLQNTTQKDGESFKVYAQRWRALASQVRPPLLETELVDMFTNTLHGTYLERMIGSTSSDFADLVRVGERIEMGVKSGKIPVIAGSQSNNSMKKPGSGFNRKKEGETNAISSRGSRAQSSAPVQFPYFPFPYLAAAQHQQFPNYQYQNPVNPVPQHHQQAPPIQNPPQARRVFDPIPMSYSQLLPYLIHSGKVTPKQLRPLLPPFPAWYDANAKCDYHAGIVGHDTNNCKAFKHKVQDLIDEKELTFKESGPNVTSDPLPKHPPAM
jgi:hypothetical protein